MRGKPVLVRVAIGIGVTAVCVSAVATATTMDVAHIPAVKVHGQGTQRLTTALPLRPVDQGLPLGINLAPDGHTADLRPWRSSGFHIAAGEQTVDVVHGPDTLHGGSSPVSLSLAGRATSMLAVVGWGQGIGKRASFGVDAGMSAMHVASIVGLPAAGGATRAGAITSVHIGVRF